ncbi:MAG: hypothetical protein JW846_10835 [Dehalococcoidia bacterium]|nr:hypothetical protein [Dehalococcoidia bacterium]
MSFHNMVARQSLAPSLDHIRGTRTTKCLEELEESQWWPREQVHDMSAADFDESIRFDVQFTDRITPGPAGKHTFVYSEVDPSTHGVSDGFDKEGH